MTQPYEPPTVETTASLNDPDVDAMVGRQVRFIREVERRMGPTKDEAVQRFLFELADFIDTERWEDADYYAFSVLFLDYQKCLSALGPGASEIGLCVSVALSLFRYPVQHIANAKMLDTLAQIERLRPRRLYPEYP